MTVSSGNDRSRISVMSFNLRFGLADDGANSWRFRKPRIAALFDAHRPDLVAFQEANGFQIDFLCEILSEYGVIGRRSPAPDFWQNNVIFFQAPWRCTHAEHFFLSHTPDIPSRFAESRWPRQCTVGIFERERHRLVAVNTHLDFDEAVQKKSAELILARMVKVSKDLPAILLGDFNAAPGSAGYRVFTESGDPAAGSAPAFSPVFAPPYAGTHHGFSGTSDGKQIDWILFRGGLRLETGEVCRFQVDGGYPSDHFPVCATFTLPQQKTGER